MRFRSSLEGHAPLDAYSCSAEAEESFHESLRSWKVGEENRRRRVVWGKGTSLRSAEWVAILYLECTLLIATDNITYCSRKSIHTSPTWEPLLRIQSLTLVRANQGEGRDATTATT